MTKNLSIAFAIIAAGNVAFAGMKQCSPQEVKIKDPGNFIERTQKTVLETIPKKTLETIVGSDTYQGLGYEILGTGKCIVDSRDGQKKVSQFIRRDQRSANCIIEGATAIPFLVTDRTIDVLTGTISMAGDIFEIDAANAAKLGISIAADGLNSNRKALNEEDSNDFFNYLGATGNGFLALLSGSFGATSSVIGAALNGVAARINVLYYVPKNVVQHSLRTGEQLFELNPENAGSSLKQVAWNVLNFVPNLIVGCENEQKIMVPSEADKKAWRDQRQPY